MRAVEAYDRGVVREKSGRTSPKLDGALTVRGSHVTRGNALR